MAYPSSIGLHPAEQTLILRLLWAPAQDDWRGEAFLELLAAFGMQVDALAGAIASRQIESLLAQAEDLPEPALSDEVQQFI